MSWNDREREGNMVLEDIELCSANFAALLEEMIRNEGTLKEV